MIDTTKIEETKDYLYCLYKAKNTIWYFNEIINNGTSNYTAVKFKNEKNVFVWLENIIIIKDSYYLGFLSENSISHKILIDDAIDWMIVVNGRLIGGYTIRYYRSSLTEEETINFDIDFGVTIDDGNDYFHPSSSTAEGAIIKIENFYSDGNLEGILSCKNFLMEAENLLNERGTLKTEEILTQVEEVLKISFIENLQSNGFPIFSNMERVFTLKEVKGNLRLLEEKVIDNNGTITFNNLWVGFSNDKEWKVLNLKED